ncbi:hypothetical protein RUM43_010532 [Polyplax serrata]|uniref:Uncharacterized protein n=1 Tax=Polyplax serrata TaxID=468196 RepID=A0AAN8S845_POLSC
MNRILYYSRVLCSVHAIIPRTTLLWSTSGPEDLLLLKGSDARDQTFRFWEELAVWSQKFLTGRLTLVVHEVPVESRLTRAASAIFVKHERYESDLINLDSLGRLYCKALEPPAEPPPTAEHTVLSTN